MNAQYFIDLITALIAKSAYAFFNMRVYYILRFTYNFVEFYHARLTLENRQFNENRQIMNKVKIFV